MDYPGGPNVIRRVLKIEERFRKVKEGDVRTETRLSV